jgi:Family of unknown function (DUF5677)
MLETRLSFFYLCIEACDDDEWECRWNLYNLHDCKARIGLMNVIGQTEDEVGLTQQAEKLRERLQANAFFCALPTKTREAFLKGNNAHLSSHEEIAEKARIEPRTYKMMWKFMSAHVHALPLSFYRMGNAERGNGVQTVVEEGYTKLLLSFAIVVLVGARDEFRELMESAGEMERVENYDL